MAYGRLDYVKCTGVISVGDLILEKKNGRGESKKKTLSFYRIESVRPLRASILPSEK